MAVDATDLEYRNRTGAGCIPPDLVSRLLDNGHADVVELQAGRGEWYCAVAWARILGEQGRQADARQVLAPYAATGWWTAVVASAGLLEDWGRADEAIEVVRTRMAAGHPMALETYARLLTRHGRAQEAFTLLRPHIDDGALATALVDAAAVAGRDDEAAELLVGRIRTDHTCDGPWCCGGLDSDTAISLLAAIRERQGRIDEAITLLGHRRIASTNGRDQLADLLARHGRIEELRAYAETDTNGEAMRGLAQLLEEGGDVEGAIAVYGPSDAPTPRDPDTAHDLARLLARHGRGAEAIAVLRAQADAHAHAGDGWLLHVLAEVCLEQGRPAEGLAHLDALDSRHAGEGEWELFRMRLPLIAACCGVDEAVERARSHPEGGTWNAAEDTAHLLAKAGRTEEAVAVLQRHGHRSSHDLAGYLIDLGRVDEALENLRPLQPQLPMVPTTHLWSEADPFRTP
ncbi:tetratricopeptide repeat protein [Streptomyces sp. NPDC001809]